MKSSLRCVLLALMLCVVLPAKAETTGEKSHVEWLESNLIAISDGITIFLYSSTFELVDTINILPYPEPDNVFFNTIYHMDWSPDADYIAVMIQDYSGESDSGIKLQVWEAASKKRLFSVDDLSINILSWSPNSEYLAISLLIPPLYGEIALLNPLKGDILHTIALDRFSDLLVWTPDSKKITADVAGGISSWHIDRPNASPDFVPLQFFTTMGLQYDTSGQRIAGMLLDDVADTINIFNLDTQQVEQNLSGHTATIIQIVWRNDLLISASLDNTTRVWNPLTGQTLITLPEGWVEELEVSPQNTQILLETAGEFTIYDIATGTVLARLDVADLPEMP
jgi:WD40 repeat protein